MSFFQRLLNPVIFSKVIKPGPPPDPWAWARSGVTLGSGPRPAALWSSTRTGPPAPSVRPLGHDLLRVVRRAPRPSHGESLAPLGQTVAPSSPCRVIPGADGLLRVPAALAVLHEEGASHVLPELVVATHSRPQRELPTGSPEPSVQIPAMIVPEGTPAARRFGRYRRGVGLHNPAPRHYHAKEAVRQEPGRAPRGKDHGEPLVASPSWLARAGVWQRR